MKYVPPTGARSSSVSPSSSADRLTSSSLFDRSVKDEINADIDRVLAYAEPVLDEALYGRLLDRVVESSRAHPKPIPLEADFS